MIKTVFIASTEPHSGKSIIAIGLVNMLLGKAQKIGYYKPIINQTQLHKKDEHIDTMLTHFDLHMTYEDTYAFTWPDAMRQMETESQGEMIDTIIRKYKYLESQYDFIVAEGTDYLGEGTAFEFEINVQIAKNLQAPVIIVVSGAEKTTAQVVTAVLTAVHNFDAREIQVLAVVANKIRPEQAKDIEELLKQQVASQILLSIVQEDKRLQSPTMKEISEQLGGKVLFGQELLANQVDNFVTGAMQVPNFLNYLSENVLIITPGDRGDIIICALQANLSSSYSKVAGIILTAGFEPEGPILRLIEGLQTVVPIIAVQTGTFQTSNIVGSIRSKITPDNGKKIRLAIDTFNKCINIPELDKRMVTFKPSGITPRMFQYQLTEWAKSSKKHIVLPEGTDERILRAAARLLSQEIVDLTILGDTTEINAILKRLDIVIDLEQIRIVNPAYDVRYDDYVNTLYELRKSKNV
ncbi:MAG: phosphate acyltransferase, partial [Mucilaginibacter sp.]